MKSVLMALMMLIPLFISGQEEQDLFEIGTAQNFGWNYSFSTSDHLSKLSYGTEFKSSFTEKVN